MIVGHGLPFLKLVGTGNDFLFIDLRAKPLTTWTALSRLQVVQRMADRHYGVGADGVIFIEENQNDDVPLGWDFYNSDGSRASMCGNATRCMGRWAHEVLKQDEVRFRSAVGVVVVKRKGDQFTSQFDFLKFSTQSLTYLSHGKKCTAQFIDTGVPHAVVEISQIADAPASEEDIRALRFHPAVGEQGANVTFLKRLSETEIQTTTFERGIEDFTLSCGTGVLAAAAIAAELSVRRRLDRDIELHVETPGGRLKVGFSKDLKLVSLVGPAHTICSGEFIEGRLL